MSCNSVSVNADTCTLQEQLGFSHAFHNIVLCWCCQCPYKTLHAYCKYRLFMICMKRCVKVWQLKCQSKMSSLDFSPKLNWVKYKLDVSGFVLFTLNHCTNECLFHTASKCKYSVTNCVQDAFKLPKIKSLYTIAISMDPLLYLKLYIHIKHFYLLYVLSLWKEIIKRVLKRVLFCSVFNFLIKILQYLRQSGNIVLQYYFIAWCSTNTDF